MLYKNEIYCHDFLAKMLSSNPTQLQNSLVNSIMQSPVKKSSDFMDLEFRKITDGSRYPIVTVSILSIRKSYHMLGQGIGQSLGFVFVSVLCRQSALSEKSCSWFGKKIPMYYPQALHNYIQSRTFLNALDNCTDKIFFVLNIYLEIDMIFLSLFQCGTIVSLLVMSVI